jgi:hypothetical protein
MKISKDFTVKQNSSAANLWRRKAIRLYLPSISIAFLACAAVFSVSASPLIARWKNAETNLMELRAQDIGNPFKTNDLFKKIGATRDEPHETRYKWNPVWEKFERCSHFSD